MSLKISVKINILMNTILTVTNFIFPLITYPYVSKILQPSGMGKVAFAQSIITYFSWLAMLGISTYGVRQCAKVRDNKDKLSKTVQELFIINCISTLIAYILLYISILLVPRFQQDSVLFIVLSASLCLNTLGMEWVYQAMERYTYITIRSIIFRFISIFLIFLLIKDPGDYVIYGGLTIFTASASYLCNFINLRKHLNFRIKEKREFVIHLKPIFTLFAASAIISIYASFDIVMLGFMKTDSEVGLYNAALKIKSIVLALSTAVTVVLVPRMVRYYQENDFGNFISLAQKSLRISLLVAVPLATYIFVFTKDVLVFISSEEFLPAIPTLRILMLCIYALILTNLFGSQMLIPMGKEKNFTQSVFIGMFINLVLNLALIPRYGATGSAVGTLVTEMFNVFWMSKAISGESKKVLLGINFVPYITGIAVSLSAAYGISLSVASLPLFIRLATTSIVFFSVYYIILLGLKEPLISQQSVAVFRKISNILKKKS